MKNETNDIIKIAAGTLVEMSVLKTELERAGVHSRVVGDDLTSGLGTTLPGSVELWISSSETVRAAAIINRSEEHPHRHDPAPQKFPHPESDPKPDRTQGPHHFPEPYRPSP